MTPVQVYFILRLLVHTWLISTNAASSCTDCDGGNMTCVDGVCLPRCIRETSSGECLQCRDSKFYGKQCQNVCPHTCLNSRCQLTNSRVVCTEGCVTGKKGDNCGVDCPTSCTHCERYGDRCVQSCKTQYYGDYCDKSCPSGCKGRCDMDMGECDNCVTGHGGRYCNVTCPMNCRDGCDKDTGECDSCTPGYRDKYCNVTCPMNCRDGCDIITGECDSCTPGYRDKYCNVTCPMNCRDGCDMITGECDSCTPGYRGRYCNVTCPMNCSDGCDKDTGKCDNCRPYFTGEYCESCMSGYGGRYCNVTCPMNCTDGCDKDTGECDTCKMAYTGRYYNETCPPHCRDGCGKDTGECGGSWHGYTVTFCNVTCNVSCTDFKHQRDTGCRNVYIDCTKVCCTVPDETVTASTDTALVICITLLAMVVTCIIIFLAIHLWKRRKRRKSPEIVISLLDNYFPMNNTSQLALSTCDIRTSTTSLQISKPTIMLTVGGGDVHHVKMCDELADEKAMDQMIAEFYKLPKPDIRPVKHGSLEENFAKNRYIDVLPFDGTRVTLETDEDEDSDYINASYINAYGNQTRYVAAQGPSFHVVDDFWRMIWQLETTKIVMLTNLVEAGKVKCEMYWPNCSDTEQYGTVCVKSVEEEVYEDYTLRTLAVWKGTFETRTLRQFHFTAWPDHGVPEETKSIIDFHRVVKETGPSTLGPIVIHCSAGIGRAGTFLAFDYLMDQARHEDSMCVYKCVKDLRLQRMKIVQTKIQYKFLYAMLFDALKYLPRTVHVVCERCWDKEDNSDRLQRPDRVSTISADQSNRYSATKYWDINDADLNRDLFTNRSLPAPRGRSQLPLQGREERPSVSLVSQSQSKTGRSKRQLTDSCDVRDQLSSVDCVLENQVYTSADVGVVCGPNEDATARVSTTSCPSVELQLQLREDRRPFQSDQADKDGSQWSVTPDRGTVITTL